MGTELGGNTNSNSRLPAKIMPYSPHSGWVEQGRRLALEVELFRAQRRWNTRPNRFSLPVDGHALGADETETLPVELLHRLAAAGVRVRNHYARWRRHDGTMLSKRDTLEATGTAWAVQRRLAYFDRLASRAPPRSFSSPSAGLGAGAVDPIDLPLVRLDWCALDWSPESGQSAASIHSLRSSPSSAIGSSSNLVSIDSLSPSSSSPSPSGSGSAVGSSSPSCL